MSELGDRFFGLIALKNGLLSRGQLEKAVRYQWEKNAGAPGPTLGEVCLKLELLNEEQVSAVLWAQAKTEALLEDTLFGELSVRNGLIVQKQLDAALEEQRKRGPGARLGHLLIESGDMTSQQVHAVLTSQKRLREGVPGFSSEEEQPPGTSLTAMKKKAARSKQRPTIED